MKENNFLDKILDNVEYNSKAKVVYEKVYIKPSKGKAVSGFLFSLVCFIALVFLFSPTVLYFMLLIGNILVLIYFTLNAFTEKGFGLPKRVPHIVLPEDEEEQVGENDEYYDQEEVQEEEYNQDEYNSGEYNQEEYNQDEDYGDEYDPDVHYELPEFEDEDEDERRQ